ncbi:non-homologous end-joining DNA ligase [Salinisphaera sp. LB1]|uniref:non-homologous end-joining DNA ligase n=1 Tax=Salinisphaera sp. LB1 TaxID=2183911 RepID=UPI000D7062E1|nr:non-homologous end-joining DNA ligase [Salinisphaera sp. LB1]AWN15956.1 ATP-dependent DNA ligase [Salinisphaera sp. LB1]
MSVQIDHIDKMFFPDAGITKGDLANYYRRIAPVMLPYVKDRPVTLNRFPDGIEGTHFIQKAVQDHYPDWLEHVTVAKEDGELVQPLINSADALAYLVGQGAIAFHVTLSRYDRPEHPDRLIFDLDPPGHGGEGGDFAPVIAAARAVRDALEAVDLTSFVMTSGSSGLHVAVPLDRHAGFDTVREFAQGIAERVADAHPEEFTTAHAKNKRGGRLYLDTRRNAVNQTAVAPYSVRPRPGAPIATPLEWDELADADIGPRRFHVGNIFRRLAQRDCPWSNIARHGQSVRRALERLRD